MLVARWYSTAPCCAILGHTNKGRAGEERGEGEWRVRKERDGWVEAARDGGRGGNLRLGGTSPVLFQNRGGFFYFTCLSSLLSLSLPLSLSLFLSPLLDRIF